jgi:thiamine-phosphate pyrophosphorylase
VADKLAKQKLARAAHRLAAGSRLPALILMTDDARLPDPQAAALALPNGGMVIVRASDARRRAELALMLKQIGVPFLIADDPWLAARVGADGIHLSEAKAKEATHWRARRPGWIITAAAHSLSACARAGHADAVLLSPIFPTQSHPRDGFLGVARARFIAQASPVPVYALGGIDAVTVAGLDDSAFIGIAAISALA